MSRLSGLSRVSSAKRLLLSLAGLLAVLLFLAPQASAHAVVVSSDPADGARLAKAPATVTLRFDEAVGLDLGYLRVVDGTGARVDAGTASHPQGDPTSVSVPLKSGLGDGTYLASFRVTSADSHPVAGSLRFVVGNGALMIGATSSGSAPVNTGISSALAVSHWLSFTGVGLVGGSWLIFTLWPSGQRRSSIRRLVWSGWTLAVVGAVGEFLLQGPYAAGSGFGSLLHTKLLDDTLHLNTGHLLSLRLVLLGLLGAALTALLASGARRRITWAAEAAAMVVVGIVVTFAASGHSQSENPRWLAVLVDSLHLVAMIVWLGGLVTLLVAALTRLHPADGAGIAGGAGGSDGALGDEQDELERDDDTAELAAGLPVFSRVAMGCVATLAVTGTIQAWREIGTLDAITTTRYGQLVLFKVVLFGVLLVLGYFARNAVLNRPARLRSRRADLKPRPERSTLGRLRRTLLTEVTIGAVVLGATAVLISQPPGKVALAAQRSKPQHVMVQLTSSSQAMVEISPAAHGNVGFEVQVIGGTKPTSVTATASLPSKELGPIPIPLKAAGTSEYTASGVLLPVAGKWQITLTVQTSEFDSTTAIATLKVS